MDLLGFSELLKKEPEIASNNMIAFQNVIKTRFVDDKIYPRDEYECDGALGASLSFKDEHSVSSFNNMIVFSDSLVIEADDPDLFIRQLCNYVATVYIEYAEPFAKAFTELETVKSNRFAAVTDGELEWKRAFPVLFRGGVALGNEVFFWDEVCIRKGKMDHNARDVSGRTYLEAVKLESSGKGPRLFCHENLVDICGDNYLFSKIDNNIDNKTDENLYEILWPVIGCECLQKSSDVRVNISNAATKTMLPPAINLLKYYKSRMDLKSVTEHYSALLDVVIKGILAYGEKHGAKDYAQKIVKEVLKRYGFEDYEIMKNM